MSRSLSKSNTPSHRAERVGELIRHAVADILSRGEVRDEALDRHPLTIPDVRMSPDLKLATILVMPLGGKGAGSAIEALERHKKELRTLVARRVNLNSLPICVSSWIRASRLKRAWTRFSNRRRWRSLSHIAPS